MPDDYTYSAEASLRADLLNHRRKCNKDHVTPLLHLMGLPTGTVITKEYDPESDLDFWEITMADKTVRGHDIIQLLIKINE